MPVREQETGFIIWPADEMAPYLVPGLGSTYPSLWPEALVLSGLDINFVISRNIVVFSVILAYSDVMTLDYHTAASLLSQLGNITRLKIVRELVRAGESGRPVGEIRNILDIPNSTLSHHLAHLRAVGLVRQEREGTILRCFVNYDPIDGIVAFLTEECCKGVPVLGNRD